MFESAELGHKVKKSVYEKEVPALRADLLEELQGQRQQLREALQAQLAQAAADYSAQAAQRIDKVFVPALDG